MRNLFYLILFLAYSALHCQSLSVFDVDTTNFPIMKAKFLAFDKDGKQVRPNASDFLLTENGQPRTLKKASCPDEKLPIAISSVLVFDVSGSMIDGPPRIESAKKAANAWIDGLPLGKSECALVSFSDYSYILQDFTTNRQLLKNSLSKLLPIGGTNYNQALIDLPNGGLQIAKKGKYKKIVVFLTDGNPNFEPNTSEIIDFAKKNQISIYGVTLNLPVPASIIKMASQTGGMYFSNITTLQEAEEVYRRILQIAQGGEPCEIEWQSKSLCFDDWNIVNLNLNTYSLGTFFKYLPPLNSSAKLQLSPQTINFKNRIPNSVTDTTISLTAINSDFTINNIKVKYGSGYCQVKNEIFPIIIKQNSTKVISLQYIPLDSAINNTVFEIETDLCPLSFGVIGGFRSKKMNTTTLKLTKPNGGEHFIAGCDTIITWEGVAESDTCNLEFSTNNGITWVSITDSATGLNYKWKNLPKNSYDSCLVRIRQMNVNRKINPKFGYIWKVLPFLNDVKYSPDGLKIACISRYSLIILDAKNSDIIKIIPLKPNYTIYAKCFCWSPDSKKIVLGIWEKDITIWDINTGLEIKTLLEKNACAQFIDWSSDGNKILGIKLIDTINSIDTTITIWDANTGLEIKHLTGHKRHLDNACFSPDGNKIASVSIDSTIKIWDVNSGNTLLTIKEEGVYIHNVKWSPDGSKILTTSVETLLLWDVMTGKIIFKIPIHQFWLEFIEWSPDGSKFASGAAYPFENNLKLWDSNTGNEINAFKANSLSDSIYSIESLSWSPDGNTICTVNNHLSLRFWDVKTGKELKSIDLSVDDQINSCWSPDGSKIVTCSDQFIRIWNSYTGQVSQNKVINPYSSAILDVIKWSPDGSRFATYGIDDSLRLWDPITLTITASYYWKSVDNYIRDISWSPDGSKIVFAVNHFSIIIIDAINGKVLKSNEINNNLISISAIDWSSDGSKIVTGDTDSLITIWDANDLSLLKILHGHTQRISSVIWSPDNKYIASISMDEKVIIWDVSTGSEFRTFDRKYNGFYNWKNGQISWGTESDRIAIGYYDGKLKILDIITGKEIKTFDGHLSDIANVMCSPDGNFIASISLDDSMILWPIDDLNIQSDISDSTFFIVKPITIYSDIDMKQCLIGSVKDSLIVDFIKNTSSYKFRADTIYFSGKDASAFSIVSGMPPYNLESGQSQNVEFRFIPFKEGIHEAKIVIITQMDTLNYHIIGEGLIQTIEAINNSIDFGTVDIGNYHDTLQVVTIKNKSAKPVEILNTKHSGPNDIDFTTLTGSGPFTINPGDIAKMDLRFKPSGVGRTSGKLEFYHNGFESPLIIRLFGNCIDPTNIESTILNSNNEIFKLNPNPAENFVTLTLNEVSVMQSEYYIYDFLGNIVTEGNISPGTKELNISTQIMQSGIYSFVLKFPNGVKRMKFIVNK